MNNTDKIKARQLCAELNDDSDDSLSGEFDNITIALPPEGTGKRAVLKAMLEPYSCTYMTVIRSLNILLKDGLLESEFVRFCIQEITKQVENGHCKYGRRKFFGKRRKENNSFNMFSVSMKE